MKEFITIVQISVTVLTLFVAVVNVILAKKTNNANNIVQISTLQRRDRMNNLQKDVSCVLTCVDPYRLSLCSQEEKAEAFHRLTEIIYSLEGILHSNFDNDAELVGLSKYLRFLVYEYVTKEEEREAIGSQIKHVSSLLSIQCDRYTYADWTRIKEELFGEHTRTQLWMDIYHNLELKYLALYQAQGILIDWHLHSVASDGVCDVREVIDMAISRGLHCISITDHDTIESQKEAFEYAKSKIIYISGIELTCQSVRFSGGAEYSLHILGYGYDCNNKHFIHKINTLQEKLKGVYEELCGRLAAEGCEMDLGEIVPKQGKMIQFSDFEGALFAKYPSRKEEKILSLLKEAERKMDACRPRPSEAISWITSANGIPVLAHPFKVYGKEKTVRLSENETEEIIKELEDCGLMGIEAYYLEHSEEQAKTLTDLAWKNRMYVSCGSDFHGSKNREASVQSIYARTVPLISLAIAKTGQNASR